MEGHRVAAALPVFGALVLHAGLVEVDRRHPRARRLLKA